MSWFLNSVGPLTAVRAEVAANSTLPDPLKQHILDLLDETPVPNQNGADGVIVKGSGHYGGGYGNINSLVFERVKLAKLPAV